MTGSGRPHAGMVAAAATLVAIYFAGTGAVYFGPAGSVASWWPAAGLSVALLALAPRSWWPVLSAGIVVFSAAANVTGGREVLVAGLFGLSNAAEALVAAWILRTVPTGPRLQSLDDFLRLVAAALAGAFTIATGAATTVSLIGDGAFVESWRSVFTSHAASTLVIVPVAMTLRLPRAALKPGELVIQSALLAAVTLASFAPSQELPLVFAPLTLLVWAALRFDVRTVTWQLLGVSILATSLTARGYGAFGAAVESGNASPVGAGAMVQLYLLCAALMSLPLSVAVEQRRLLLDDVSARELLFRRNFTESLTAMLLLEQRGDRLEIVDANEAARQLLEQRGTPLIGRFLDRLLDQAASVREGTRAVLDGERDGWHGQVGLLDRPDAQVNVAVSMLSGGAGPTFSAQLHDVTPEHSARVRIEAAEKLTSATLDTTPCLILVTDMAGTVVRANAAASALTGWREDEIVGKPMWGALAPPSRIPYVKAMFDAPDGSGIPLTREADAQTASGTPLRVVWNNKLVRDEAGRPTYAVFTGVDVTAERTTAGLMTHLLEAAITTALIGIDPGGTITVFNSGAQNLLGYGAADVVGTPFTRLLDARELEKRTAGQPRSSTFAALTAAIGTHGETTPRDWTWIGADGTRHTVSMSLSMAADEYAAKVGFLCVGRDVTEQRHSQEMLIAALDKERTAVERLRKLDVAKNEFVSTVSHELRTPVTSIMGYTEMLKDGTVVVPDPGQLAMLDTIARNGERLLVICNDLLTLGGLDAGVQGPDRERVDLVPLLEHVEESARPLLKGRDLGVTFATPAEPVLVEGDPIQLERAVLNLLSNAIKFTEDGGKVECRLDTRGDEARLTVHDDGLGIPEDEQAGLFQKFFRSSTAQNLAIQGTGLGLSIVAGIVGSHGGRIGVESAHLAGTTFVVRLPLARG